MALNIKKALQKHNLMAKEVAARMGISDVAMSQHINGKPSVGVLERIAAAIGCDIVELFDPLDDNVCISSAKSVCPHCGGEIDLEVKTLKKPRSTQEA